MLFTYEQAAEYLGIKKSTLYAMVSEGRVPHVRLGPRLVRFEKAAIDAWINGARQGEGPHAA